MMTSSILNLVLSAETCWYGVCSDVGGSVDNVEGFFATANAILGMVKPVAIVLAVALLIYAGWLFVTSAGDAQKVETATKTTIAVIVGMVILFVFGILLNEILVRFL